MPLVVGPTKFIYKVDRIDKLIDGTIILLDYKDVKLSNKLN